jgi:peptidyl-dipeptidase Dcp
VRVFASNVFSLKNSYAQDRGRLRLDAAAGEAKLWIMSDNPFFLPRTTPHGAPPFASIRPEHYPPALQAGMDAHIAEIEAIAANPEPPTFENTVEALERSGKLLDDVGGVFFNLNSANGNDGTRAIERDFAPKLAEHSARIGLHPGLFARIAALYARRDSLGLDAVQLRLLERKYLNFVRAGAALDAAGRARVEAISQRLAVLHTEFGQNVLHDEQEWQLQLFEGDLDGLPDFVRDGTAQAAAERGEGGHVVTLSRSLIEPFLKFSPRRALREIAYRAWIARGTHEGAYDNTKLIPEILALRRERAALLGYADYALYRLADSMAGSPEAARRLTDEVWPAAVARAEEERAQLQEEADADGLNDAIQPWDWAYYAERVRRRRYAIDEAELKPYFVFENIQNAAFDTAKRLFGLDFLPRPDIAAYHKDVTIFEVQAQGRHVGLFVSDPFARADKRSGAWMSSFRDQEKLSGDISPIIVNVNNFAKSKPTLLSFDDAETLFHEFGHALHGLLSDVRYPSQSGTAVLRDFVEFPSQIMEHWISSPETLRRFARHYETDAPIPDDLIARLHAAQNFNQGFATTEYTAAAILDLELHRHPDPANLDVIEFEKEVLDRIGLPPEIGVRHRAAHFQHLFAGSGYSASYYAYQWAEVLDADGFDAFEARGDLFDPTLAAGLRRVFSAGDTEDPMKLFTEFRGHAPSTAALMRQRGLVA